MRTYFLQFIPCATRILSERKSQKDLGANDISAYLMINEVNERVKT